jgi:regulator of sigma E protease
VAVLYFGFLVLSHELGHFSAAKAFKVKVLEFSMGMGPRLLKKQKGETLFSLKAIPFGGSCLMEGEDESSENPRAFGNQRPWKRFIILFAGAFVNLLCGVLIMGAIVAANPGTTTRVGDFANWAVTQAQGVKTGDQIVRVNGKRVYSWIDVGFLTSRAKDGAVQLTVRRGGKTLKLSKIQFPKVEYEDGTQAYHQDFTLQAFPQEGSPVLRGLRTAKQTVLQSVTVGRMVWLSLLDMVTGKFSMRDISGPIGVVTLLSDGAQQVQQGAASGNKAEAVGSLLDLLLLFSMISLNIGIMNLLPLPALDGGRLLFCLVEIIFRKPLPKKFEAVVHGVGFALLMLFLVFVSFSDVWALITGKR